MACWCGHGPWHRWGGYAGYGPPPYPAYGPPPRFARRRVAAEDLEAYLRDLERQIQDVRKELDSIRAEQPRADGARRPRSTALESHLPRPAHKWAARCRRKRRGVRRQEDDPAWWSG